MQQNETTAVQLSLTTSPGNEMGLFYYNAPEPTWVIFRPISYTETNSS